MYEFMLRSSPTKVALYAFISERIKRHKREGVRRALWEAGKAIFFTTVFNGMVDEQVLTVCGGREQRKDETAGKSNHTIMGKLCSEKRCLETRKEHPLVAWVPRKGAERCWKSEMKERLRSSEVQKRKSVPPLVWLG